jgi:CRP/FNR family transcriptional regulator, cyclic AMP receptor protein
MTALQESGGALPTAQDDELRLPKGTVIFRQGDAGHQMFVISEGRVRLTLGAGGFETEVAVLKKGEFFGELSLLNGAPRTATAEAIEDSTLLRIDREAFGMMMQDDLDIIIHMMSVLSQRLSQTDNPIFLELLRRMSRVRIAAHCVRRAFTANGTPAPAVGVEELGTDLGLSMKETEATLSDLTRRGAGTLERSHWHLESLDQMQHLIEILGRYAAGVSG